MILQTFNRLAVVGFVCAASTLAACTTADEPRPDADPDQTMPATQPMEGMQGMEGMPGMQDADAMRRHARELAEMTARLRQHIQLMRQLSATEQHDRMGGHVAQVSQLLNLVNRQVQEMDMGMGMSDEEMGRMMGMSGEEHRRMMNEMQAIRSEVEQLQTASPAEVRERMPTHLERLERTTELLDASADAMRRS